MKDLERLGREDEMYHLLRQSLQDAKLRCITDDANALERARKDLQNAHLRIIERLGKR